MSTTKMYVINTLSNMHVGSGEVNYGVIDNLIQRDPVTNLPGINSSGLKGGIREYFRDNSSLVKEVFGSEKKDQKNTQPGLARFFEAYMLSIPVRSNKTPYMMATSIHVMNELITRLQAFGCQDVGDIITKLDVLVKNLPELEGDGEMAFVFEKNLDGAYVEDLDLKATYKDDIKLDPVITPLFGERLVLLSNKAFMRINDDNHLPVLARNNLTDGVSSNLWYEQILPRYTRLYFMLMDDGVSENLKEDFEKELSEGIFQLGANASIGYGFCKFIELSTIKNLPDEKDRS